MIKNKNLGIRLWGFKSWFYQSQAFELWANGLTCDSISFIYKMRKSIVCTSQYYPENWVIIWKTLRIVWHMVSSSVVVVIIIIWSIPSLRISHWLTFSLGSPIDCSVTQFPTSTSLFFLHQYWILILYSLFSFFLPNYAKGLNFSGKCNNRNIYLALTLFQALC